MFIDDYRGLLRTWIVARDDAHDREACEEAADTHRLLSTIIGQTALSPLANVLGVQNRFAMAHKIKSHASSIPEH